MGSTLIRLCSLALLGVAPLWGASCNPAPTGATFSPATGVLSVYGTEGPDLLVVGAGADGSILVNGGQMPIRGGAPTLADLVGIEVRGRGGSDYLELDEAGGPLPGGRLFGGPGADVLVGGSGDDEVTGGADDDIAVLGDGDDTFVWQPGDALDTVEGEGGFDTLRFYGEDVNENVDVSANAGRVRFFQLLPFHDLATVTTDLGGVEAVDYHARGGTDAVVVNDLAGTEMTQIRVDLSAAAGGGDGQPDTIALYGTQGGDGVGIASDAGEVEVAGLHADVRIAGQESAADRLTLHMLGGADTVDATGLAAGVIALVLNGGLGVDVLAGGEGDDLINGGDGDDVVGMGGGDDTFVWSPGDDLDTVEGQDGYDTLLFNGANVAETIDVSAQAGRVRFFRNVATVTLDLAGVEVIDFLARGGADLVFVQDLSGTDVLAVNVDLAAAVGGGDAQADSVFVNGTGGDDAVQVFGGASEVSVTGLAADVNVTTGESTDFLGVYLHGGDDVVQASGLTTPAIGLTADGGDDDDVLIGGDGVDVLFGGEGDDVLQGGPGVDVLDGGPGSNIVIQ